MGLNWAYEFNVCVRREFKISLETDDIIDFSSYKKGIEILKKYKVDLYEN